MTYYAFDLLPIMMIVANVVIIELILGNRFVVHYSRLAFPGLTTLLFCRNRQLRVSLTRLPSPFHFFVVSYTPFKSISRLRNTLLMLRTAWPTFEIYTFRHNVCDQVEEC